MDLNKSLVSIARGGPDEAREAKQEIVRYLFESLGQPEDGEIDKRVAAFRARVKAGVGRANGIPCDFILEDVLGDLGRYTANQAHEYVGLQANPWSDEALIEGTEQVLNGVDFERARSWLRNILLQVTRDELRSKLIRKFWHVSRRDKSEAGVQHLMLRVIKDIALESRRVVTPGWLDGRG